MGSFDENFDLAHELAVKVNAKFINMRSLMYGFLAHHDGLFVRREAEEPRLVGAKRLDVKPAPLKPAPLKRKPAPLKPAPLKRKPAPLSPAPKGWPLSPPKGN